jgi:hypothetical protein
MHEGCNRNPRRRRGGHRGRVRGSCWPWSFSEEAAAEKYIAQLQHNMWVANLRSSVLSIITGGGKWVESPRGPMSSWAERTTVERREVCADARPFDGNDGTGFANGHSSAQYHINGSFG